MRLAEDLWYDLGARRMETLASAAARLEEIVSMTFLAEGDDELPDSWKLWVDLWAQSVHHPEVARVREEFDAHWRETIADIVRGGQASGNSSNSTPPSSRSLCPLYSTGWRFKSRSMTRWSTLSEPSGRLCGSPPRHSVSPGSRGGSHEPAARTRQKQMSR